MCHLKILAGKLLLLLISNDLLKSFEPESLSEKKMRKRKKKEVLFRNEIQKEFRY